MEDSTYYIKVCPKCGNNLQLSITEASKTSRLKCNKCGHLVDLKDDRDKIETIRKNLIDIEKDIKRFHELAL